MSPGVTRQRSVGAVALLVLTGVMWLLLFGLDQEPEMDLRSQIPSAPEFTPYRPEEPRPPEGVEAVETPALPMAEDGLDTSDADSLGEPLQSSAAADQEPTASIEPGLDEQGLPRAWVIQVASLSSRAKAEALRDQLRAAGHKAYTEAGANGTTRVLVGPKLHRQQLERDKQAIDEALGLDSLILRFDPAGGS